MSDRYSSFWVGLFIGLVAMGILETCVPGIGYHDAMKSKLACEKSLPRDQTCTPNYVPTKAKDNNQ